VRIAITGSSGRVGRAVVDLAVGHGHQVVCIDRVPPPTEVPPEVTFVPADIADYAGVVEAIRDCDALVHLAAIPAPYGDPDHVVHNNNVVGSYNALRAAAELGIRRVCQASSINAIGGAYSRVPRYDYFPLDEQHPTYAEDAYSLSKWICEQQADALARRYEAMTIASLRFHRVVPDRSLPARDHAGQGPRMAQDLWGYTSYAAAARACLLSLTADFTGSESFYVVAPDTSTDVLSLELAAQFYPQVPVRGDLSGCRSFFDSGKAERLLGWKHDSA
jgi:UDP-glucose 4-epimerase